MPRAWCVDRYIPPYCQETAGSLLNGWHTPISRAKKPTHERGSGGWAASERASTLDAGGRLDARVIQRTSPVWRRTTRRVCDWAPSDSAGRAPGGEPTLAWGDDQWWPRRPWRTPPPTPPDSRPSRQCADAGDDGRARRLGYRFRLIDAIIPLNAVSSAPFSVIARITNEGFARPYNPRDLELVLRHTVSGAVTRIRVGQSDIRLVLPGPGETTTLTLTAQLPMSLASGDYDVLLNLPDPAPTLNARPEYSIRLANEGVWEPATGYNRLLATITVSNGTFLPTIMR